MRHNIGLALTKLRSGEDFANLIDELNDRLLRKGVHLVVSPSAKRVIIRKGYDENTVPVRYGVQFKTS